MKTHWVWKMVNTGGRANVNPSPDRKLISLSTHIDGRPIQSVLTRGGVGQPRSQVEVTNEPMAQETAA